MNKTSSKLADGVRKVKARQESAAETEPPKAAPAPKPAPQPVHPDRVWPD
ncbi:MAG: hypothetical protein M0Z73_12360 [Betaproteobacteria bacterium]|nr:hypothetical protein [Betaproteobacteria bacterium]